MLTLILIILSLIATFLVVYFTQILKDGIIVWSIPLYFIGFILAIFILFLLILYTITLFIRPDKKLAKPKYFYRFFINMAAEFLVGFLRLDLVVMNKELIPRDKTFLLVSNHQSNVDPIISVWAFHEYNLTYIMKDGMMKTPLVGRFLYGAGFLPLNRKNNRKAIETIALATKRIIDGIHPIAIYPEGTRSKGPSLGEFRNGAFKIAQKSKCPIVVTVVDSTYKFKKNFPLKRTKVLIEVMKVINYEEYKDLNTTDLGNHIHTLIAEHLQQRRSEFTWL